MVTLIDDLPAKIMEVPDEHLGLLLSLVGLFIGLFGGLVAFVFETDLGGLIAWVGWFVMAIGLLVHFWQVFKPRE